MTADPAAPQEQTTRHVDLLGMRKLNLGCGFDLREGYLNVDAQSFHDPDLLADVRSLGMLPSGCYDEIVAQDVLEHLARSDVSPALLEWSRLLTPGGRLVLRVPDLVGLLGLLVAHPSVEVHQELEQCLYGTQAYTGDFHQSGFTELTLRQRLASAGLSLFSLSRRDEWLFDAVAIKDGADSDLAPQFLEPGWTIGLRAERDQLANALAVMRSRRGIRWVDAARDSSLMRRVAPPLRRWKQAIRPRG